MRALLDVNVLLALFDAQHIHHNQALTWWTDNRRAGWASSPLTQNGFIRVISSPRYRHPRAFADAIALLRAQIAQPGHAFWPDDISIADPDVVDHSRLLGPNQITDVYLLALAVKNAGFLVTFDRSVPIRAVRGAETKNLTII
jgi:uncharacterized protein